MLISRWNYAIGLLSLDCIAPFLTDLWFDVRDSGAFRSCVRRVVAPYLNADRYYKEFEVALCIVFRSIARDLGLDVGHSLSHWVQNVLVAQGPDRRQEEWWKAVLLNVPAARDPSNALDREPVRRLISSQRNESLKIESRVRERLNYPVSEWDASVLPVIFNTISDISNTVELIMKLNAFSELWEHHLGGANPETLLEIHNGGKAIAGQLGIPTDELQLPGNWAIEHWRPRNTASNRG